MVEGGSGSGAIRRAFDALTFEEEKHVMLGKAHWTLAGSCRAGTVVGQRPEREQGSEQTNFGGSVSGLVKELQEAVEQSTSKEVLSDSDVMLVANLALAGGQWGSQTKSGGQRESETQPRAFSALSFDEERHAIMGKGHLALAAECRRKHLQSQGIHSKELELARKARDDTFRELEENLLTRASPEIFTDRETILVAMRCHGHALSACSEELRNDADVVLAAYSSDPTSWRDAGDAIRQDRDTVLKAMRIDGYGLELLSEGQQADAEIVLAAAGSSPDAFAYASATLKGDREVVLAVLKMQHAGGVLADSNALRFASPAVRADREVVLEAIKFEGCAMALASLELRQDKDFMLQAMRNARPSEEYSCFLEADGSVLRAVPWEEAEGAAASKLAVAGETAPVLTVEFTAEEGVCQVTLISGTSFPCSLPTSPSKVGQTHKNSSNDPEDVPQEKLDRPGEAGEPGADAADSTDSTADITVGALAELVLAELPKHVEQMSPERAFIVLAKSGSSGEAPVQVTPWDWNQPLSHFF